MPTEEEKYKAKVQYYYAITLNDIAHGVAIQELEEEIYVWAEEEVYEACVGIRKAIDEYKHKTLKDIKNASRYYKKNSQEKNKS